MSRHAPELPTLLAAILLKCAEEEGGVRALARPIGISHQSVYRLVQGTGPGKHVLAAVQRHPGDVSLKELRRWCRTRVQFRANFSSAT